MSSTLTFGALLCSYVTLFCTAQSQPETQPQSWYAVGQQVPTTSGYIKGHAATLAGAIDVSEYLGIRFGKSTAGKNRFLKPQPFLGDGSFDAAKFGNGCPYALFVAPPGAPGVPPPINNTLSEDCLFLNVWTKPQVGERKKAVMVWIYGGGFSMGDSADPNYNGAKLAGDKDVVVVSMNYRTNIFGFPGSPDIPDRNVGLLDQRLALEWVAANIEQFGGDKSRVTLWGQSAGSSSVDYYSYGWDKTEPLVHAFIEESGTAMMTGPFAPQTQAVRTPAWFNLTMKLGCGGKENGAAALECAQRASVTQIQAAMPSSAGFQMVVGSFGPTYDNKIVFKDVYKRGADGTFIPKPLLGGSNQNESLIFSLIPPGASPEIDLEIQNGFRCGAANAAKARYLNDVPVWRYHYSGTAKGSNTGATHGQEIPLIFLGGPGLAKIFQDAWVAFAKDPYKGLTKYGWPRYHPFRSTLIRLGYDGAQNEDFVDANFYDGTCPPSPIGWGKDRNWIVDNKNNSDTAST